MDQETLGGRAIGVPGGNVERDDDPNLDNNRDYIGSRMGIQQPVSDQQHRVLHTHGNRGTDPASVVGTVLPDMPTMRSIWKNTPRWIIF